MKILKFKFVDCKKMNWEDGVFTEKKIREKIKKIKFYKSIKKCNKRLGSRASH